MVQLNEATFVTDFVKKVFNAILGDRNRQLEKAMGNDPAFKKIIADVERSKIDLERWVAQRIEKDQALKKKLGMVQGL